MTNPTPPLPAPRCCAVIDTQALRHNLAALKRRTGGRAQVMAVVKADAYGHGLAGVANALCGEVAMFGVANLAEGLQLRDCHVNTPVFVLSPVMPDERAAVAAAGFIPVLSDIGEARAFSVLAGSSGMEAHLAVDTGMGRAGITPGDAVEFARAAAALPGLRITGFATHLPSADEDAEFTAAQLAQFSGLSAAVRNACPSIRMSHALNSAGALVFPDHAPDLIRAGLALYGVSPLPEFQDMLQPALEWQTRVGLVRDIQAGQGISYGRTFVSGQPMRVATLAAGYADGYPRILSGRGSVVLLGGRRCAVLGRITMDQIVVDVSAVPGVRAGDSAVLLGRQGDECIPAWELAHRAETVPWEIFTGIQQRVTRLYT